MMADSLWVTDYCQVTSGSCDGNIDTSVLRKKAYLSWMQKVEQWLDLEILLEYPWEHPTTCSDLHQGPIS